MEKIKEKVPNFRHIDGTKLFRSSRPDHLEGEALDEFLNLGIRSIIDLRSMREFPGATGCKSVDDHYVLFAVSADKSNKVIRKTIDKNGKEKTLEKLDLESYAGYEEEKNEKVSQEFTRTHSVFDLVSKEYARAVLSRTNFAVKGMLLGMYYIDCVFGSSLFLKGLVQHAINAHGLLGQYQDIIDHCGLKIRLVLQTMSNKNQAPCLVNCAYGKDRTGVITALALSLLGKSPDFIADDYAKSAPELEKENGHIQAYLQQLRFNQSFYKSDRETMVKLLEYINEKYGSVPEYLSHIGFTESWQVKLKEALIADEDSQSKEN